MRIAVCYYSEKAPLPMLELWLENYKKSKCKIPIVILTDGKSQMPKDPSLEIMVLQDLRKYSPILRPNKGFDFDMKGALICEAITRFDKFFLVDTDAFFKKDPKVLLEQIPSNALLSMGDDPYPRRISGTPDDVVVRNAGVMFVQAPDKVSKTTLMSMYESAFQQLRRAHDHDLLEQNVWSYVHFLLMRKGKAQVFSRYLNWSRVWDSNDPNIVVHHEHGPQKWAKYKIKKP